MFFFLFFVFILKTEALGYAISQNNIITIENAMMNYQMQTKRPCSIVIMGNFNFFHLTKTDPNFQITKWNLNEVNVNETLHEDGKNLIFGTGCTFFVISDDLVSFLGKIRLLMTLLKHR